MLHGTAGGTGVKLNIKFKEKKYFGLVPVAKYKYPWTSVSDLALLAPFRKQANINGRPHIQSF